MNTFRSFYALIVVVFLGFILVGIVGVALFNDGLIESKKKSIAHVLNIARDQSVIYVEQYRQGSLSKQQARDKIIAYLSTLRSGSSYVWANDENAIATVHIRDGVVGTFQKSYPKHMAELIDKKISYIVETNIKPGSNNRTLKINGVTKIPDWDWIVGYGVYLDEENITVLNFITYFISSIFLLFVLTVFMAYVCVNKNRTK